MRLSAAKSRVGHAEPAAGAVGVASLSTMLMQGATGPMLSLRHVCPFLSCAVATMLLWAWSTARVCQVDQHIALIRRKLHPGCKRRKQALCPPPRGLRSGLSARR